MGSSPGSCHYLCSYKLDSSITRYTYSNKWNTPAHEHLDRVVISLTWDVLLPNTSLSSCTCTTSDHVLLKMEISTTVPKFIIYPFWKFLDATHFLHWVHRECLALSSPSYPPHVSIVCQLKRTRAAAKGWLKHYGSCSQWENDCKLDLRLLDAMEEICLLIASELTLRSVVVKVLAHTVKESSSIGSKGERCVPRLSAIKHQIFPCLCHSVPMEE
jgi:hypothetical protein